MFVWDIQKALVNYKKHGVSFNEAATVFVDLDGLHFEDFKHSDVERRYLRLALSINKRILLVVYTIRGRTHEQETIKIISARQASRQERQTYVRFKT